jgi:hypothetical protein
MSAKSAEQGLSPEQMRAPIATPSSPDRVSSAFGELRFFDGVPTAETVDTIYDAPDLIRGAAVFLSCLPGASLVAVRRGLRSIGVSSPAEDDDGGVALPGNPSFVDLAIRLVSAVGERSAAGGAVCGS